MANIRDGWADGGKGGQLADGLYLLLGLFRVPMSPIKASYM